MKILKGLLILLFILGLISPTLAADIKVTEMTEDTAPTGDDLVMTVNNPTVTPANRKVKLQNISHTLFSNIGTLTHSTIDSYLNQSVQTGGSPAFLQSTLTGAGGTYGLHMPNATAIWMKDIGGIERNVMFLGADTAPGTLTIGQDVGQITLPKNISITGNITITGTVDGIDVSAHPGLITGVHGLVFTAGKTLTLTESLTLNALPVGGLGVATSANTLGSLAVGLTTQVLVGGGSGLVPTWETNLPNALTIGNAYIYRAGGTDIPVTDGGTGLSTLTQGYIPFGQGTSAFGSDEGLFWDNTNKRLAIGTTGPTGRLDIVGSQNFTAFVAPIALTASTPTAGGACTPGLHSYKVTFTSVGSGETTAGTVSGQITCVLTTGQTVPLSAIPTGPTGTIGRKIYRTVAGDTGSYLLLTTIADNITTIYSDIIADASLGVAAPASNTTAVANLQTGGTTRMVIDNSGNINIAGLTASKPVLTDASKNLVSGTLGSDTQVLFNDGGVFGGFGVWNKTSEKLTLRNSPSNYLPWADNFPSSALGLGIGTSAVPDSSLKVGVAVEKYSSSSGGSGGVVDITAQFSIIKQAGSTGALGLMGYGQNTGTNTGSVIGLAGFAHNVKTSGGSVWGGWFIAGDSAGQSDSIITAEFGLRNKVDGGHKTTPSTPGLSIGAWVAGSDYPYTWAFGIGVETPGGQAHTGLMVTQNSIVPYAGGINEAIRIRGGSTVANRYGGIILTDYLAYGLDLSSATISDDIAISLGASHYIYWFGSPNCALLRSGNDIWWWNGSIAKQIVKTDDSPTFNSLTAAGTISATTAKLTNLTDGYLPYHVSDTSGLANSVIYTDGTNVGIGTTGPGANLDVYGTGTVESRVITDTTVDKAVSFLTTAGNPFITYQGATLRIGAVSGAGGAGFSDKVAIDTDGNVGIGTTSPTAKLDVHGLSTFGTDCPQTGIVTALGPPEDIVASIPFTALRSVAVADGWGTGIRLQTIYAVDMVDGMGPKIKFEIRDNAGVDNTIGHFGMKRAGADNSGMFSFNAANAGTDSIESMRVYNDGNIATTETALLIRVNRAGVYTLDRVSVGAADSGGTNFKVLRVPN